MNLEIRQRFLRPPQSPNYQRKLLINLVKEVHIICILKT
jgi:hypothetical protein